MHILLGSDDDLPVVLHLVTELRRLGHEVTHLPVMGWGLVAREVAQGVADGRANMGVVCCWTGTGVSIVANKIRKIRAALCPDAGTAEGARRWNDANVLALGLRGLGPGVATEIVRAFLTTAYDGTEGESLEVIRTLDER